MLKTQIIQYFFKSVKKYNILNYYIFFLLLNLIIYSSTYVRLTYRLRSE